MWLARWEPRLTLAVGVLALACGGDGGGGTGPCTPGTATQLVKTSGDPARWYLNNPLPTPLSVTARDASNCPVPGEIGRAQSELQSQSNLVCRLLLEKKKNAVSQRRSA